MAQQPSADVRARKIRTRISQLDSEIDDERYAQDVAFTHDYEYRMSDARIEALKTEREKLKEILGDL